MKKINLFIITYLGFLKHVPLLPFIYDVQLKLCTALFKPQILDAVDDIEREVFKWPGVKISLHKYGGLQFNYAGKEMGHIHGNGLLDIPLNRKIKQELMLDDRAEDHHTFKNSGWISFYIKNKDDGKYAVELLRQSYARLVKRFTPQASSAVPAA